jgi:hypothetical protein
MRVTTVLIAILLSSCACTPWPGQTVIRSHSGHKVCAKHRVRLVTVRGYEVSDGTLVDQPQAWHDIAVCFPNHVPEYQSLTRDLDFLLAVRITYCRACEKELQTRWKKKDEELKRRFRERSNHAMERTADRCTLHS